MTYSIKLAGHWVQKSLAVDVACPSILANAKLFSFDGSRQKTSKRIGELHKLPLAFSNYPFVNVHIDKCGEKVLLISKIEKSKGQKAITISKLHRLCITVGLYKIFTYIYDLPILRIILYYIILFFVVVFSFGNTD